MSPDSIDAVCTDPPYHLTSIVKRFGKPDSAPALSNGETGVYARASSGFMGKQWDGGDIAFRPETWATIMRVMKPGAHLVAFGHPKNFHRLMVAIEDAGFEIRDTLMWVYGQGFPKSHNVANKLDRWLDYGEDGEDRKAHVVDQWEGWGTALKPAWEPIILARKPLIGTVAENVLAHGTGAINIDGCRVPTDVDDLAAMEGRSGKSTPNKIYGANINGGGVTEGTWQPRPDGRWPANVVHDGSPEVVSLFPASAGQQGDVRGDEPSHTGDDNTVCYGEFDRVPFARRSDQGSAARFFFNARDGEESAERLFYHAKATKADRAGSKHPTVKPINLLRWLVRMITPPGGTVLDPFAGSGTTAAAALAEGAQAVLCERENEYIIDIENRLSDAPDSLPLFDLPAAP